jgi:hypothetical protein
MTMQHRFAYPKVTELRTTRPEAPTAAPRVAQRELVAASLIRCPNPPKGLKAR